VTPTIPCLAKAQAYYYGTLAGRVGAESDPTRGYTRTRSLPGTNTITIRPTMVKV